MPKPFPWPLNVGTDICSIPRILRIISKNTGPRFVRRVLTVEERDHYQGRVEKPLQKWQETVRRQQQIDWKRNTLGISRLELAHCFDLRKAGREGTPSAWLREFRRQHGGGVGSAKLNLSSEAPDNLYGANFNSIDSIAEARSPEPGSFRVVGEQGGQTSESATEERTTSIASPVEATSKNGVDNLDAMLRLMDENEKANEEAKSVLQSAAVFMAGRFAAKEATMKAHHNQRLTYHRISILPAPMTKSLPGSRPPVSVVIPEDGKWEDGQEVKISISHDGDYATAVCLACNLELGAVPKMRVDCGHSHQES